jgi:hypothetical protein
MNIPRIQSAAPKDGHILIVTFTNGKRKKYDVNRLTTRESFAPLKIEAFFKNVTVEPGGYAVSWNAKLILASMSCGKTGKKCHTATRRTGSPGPSPCAHCPLLPPGCRHTSGSSRPARHSPTPAVPGAPGATATPDRSGVALLGRDWASTPEPRRVPEPWSAGSPLQDQERRQTGCLEVRPPSLESPAHCNEVMIPGLPCRLPRPRGFFTASQTWRAPAG